MGKAPKPDPNMGVAATLSAETGLKMLDFMKEQSAITNQWADQDRKRYQDIYAPMETAYAMDAQAASDPSKIGLNADLRASEAVGDVRQQFALQADADNRRMRSMGVRPDSGRDAALGATRGTAEALASAGAANMARRQSILGDEAKGDGMMANAINMGKGMAVNPATSMGLSNNAGASGYNGAMTGYGQQANILGKQYDQQMQAWQASNAGWNAIGGALGTIAGFASSKKIKQDKEPIDALGAVKKMPVERWKYKKGEGDGQAHIGPYAEDFAKATGVGDGKSIDALSMIGVTLGAVRQLADKVDKLETGNMRKAA